MTMYLIANIRFDGSVKEEDRLAASRALSIRANPIRVAHPSVIILETDDEKEAQITVRVRVFSHDSGWRDFLAFEGQARKEDLVGGTRFCIVIANVPVSLEHMTK